MSDPAAIKRRRIRDLYRVDWLHPEDAPTVAALESQVHTSAHRAGEGLIATQLAVTADEGRNLSLGLYRGTRLVGFLLAFVARNRREIAEFFDAPLPPDRDPDERTVYLADFVVLPRHRVATSLLSARLVSILLGRDDLRSLTADAFSTVEYAAFWKARGNYFLRLGWQLSGHAEFHDQTLGTRMYWLTLDPIHAARSPVVAPLSAALKAADTVKVRNVDHTVGYLNSTAEWRQLELEWDPLWALAIEPNHSQGYEYLRTWWSQVGAVTDLFMPIVLRARKIVAIAPLQIVSQRRMGRQVRCLTFMNQSPEVSVGTVLVDPKDNAAIEALATFVAGRTDLWDCVQLGGQAPNDRFIEALEHSLRARGALTGYTADTSHGYLSIQSSWESYLDARPAPLKQALDVARTSLASVDPLEFEVVRASDGWESLLDRFKVIELASPVAMQYQGVGITSANWSFYRDLAARQGTALGMTAGFLKRGREDVAAILGYQVQGTYTPIHVTQTAAGAPFGADLLVTCHQMEWAFVQGGCSRIELLSDRVPFLREWASTSLSTVCFTANERTLAGMTMQLLYSVIKPGLKRLLGRTQ